MKHLRSGFSIIEMMISLVLSAMLMTASLTIYNQISKGAFTIQRITQADTQIMILHNRLTADLQGLCPLWFTLEHYEKLKQEKEAKGAQENAKSTTTNNASTKKRNNFLYAQSNDAQFDLLTFITTNALQVYGDKPRRTVRVMYLLQPEEHNLTTFKLMRKEDDTVSGDFDLEKLKTDKFDQIVHKITQCKVEYGFIEKQGKKPDTSQQTDKPFEFKFVSKWGGATETEKEDEKTPKLPDILKLTLKIQHAPNQDAKSYELFCTIPTCHASSIKSFAQQRQEQNKQKPELTAKDNAPKDMTPKNEAPKGDVPKNMGFALISGTPGVHP